MNISRWFCDIRIGMVAVYYGHKELNCLSGISECSAFVGHAHKENGNWVLPRQTIKLAREREQVRGENKSKSLREGSSFMGGLGSLIEKATRPAPRRTKRKRKKAKMSRTMTQSSIFGNRGGGFF